MTIDEHEWMYLRCACGGSEFRLLVDVERGGAQRTCSACRRTRLICVALEDWVGAKTERVRCSCGADTHEVAVTFSGRDENAARRISVTVRCVSCGAFESVADWPIEPAPANPVVAGSTH